MKLATVIINLLTKQQGEETEEEEGGGGTRGGTREGGEPRRGWYRLLHIYSLSLPEKLPCLLLKFARKNYHVCSLSLSHIMNPRVFRKLPKKLLGIQGSEGILGFRNFVDEVNKIEKFRWEKMAFMCKSRSSCMAPQRIRNCSDTLVVGHVYMSMSCINISTCLQNIAF